MSADNRHPTRPYRTRVKWTGLDGHAAAAFKGEVTTTPSTDRKLLRRGPADEQDRPALAARPDLLAAVVAAVAMRDRFDAAALETW